MEVPEPIFEIIHLAAELPEQVEEIEEAQERKISEPDIESISLGEVDGPRSMNEEEEKKANTSTRFDSLAMVEERKDSGRFVEEMVKLEKEIKESQ